MDKEQAINAFWNGFGLVAYDETSVPTGEDSPSFPFITFDVRTDSLNAPVTVHGSLWYRSTSWADVVSKLNQIAEYIGVGGKVVKIDGGYMWVSRGMPFAQRMRDPNDDSIRRMYINLTIEFLTAV